MSTSSTPTNPGTNTDSHALYEQVIQRISELSDKVSALQKQQDIQSQRRRANVYGAARTVRKVVDCFTPIWSFYDEAERRAEFGSDTESTQVEDALYQKWIQLGDMIPELRRRIAQQEPVEEFLTKIQELANDARAVDFNHGRSWSAEFINADFDDARLSSTGRSNRGHQHDILGGFLCDAAHDWTDTEVRAKIRSNTPGYSPGDAFFCNILYENLKGDANDLRKGFLKSKYLLMFYASIFTSPSSAGRQNIDFDTCANDGPPRKHFKTNDGTRKATKTNVATRAGLHHRVTPPSIAYTAVILHANLTDMNTWSETYNGFCYPEFYNFIVDYFNAPTGTAQRDQTDKLLEWWTQRVFPEAVNQNVGATAAARARLAAQVIM